MKTPTNHNASSFKVLGVLKIFGVFGVYIAKTPVHIWSGNFRTSISFVSLFHLRTKLCKQTNYL